MREFLVILCASIILSSCEKEDETPAVEVIRPRKEDVAAIRNILDGAVARQRNVPPNQARGRTLEEAQAIFQDFWNPNPAKPEPKGVWRDCVARQVRWD